MSYRDDLVEGIALIDSELDSLKSSVVHRVWTGDGGVGTDAYTNRSRSAFVDQRKRQVRSFSGEVVMCSATVTFTTAGVAVAEHDRLILADGTEAEVVGTGGYMDPVTLAVMYTEAYLG